MNTPEAKPLVFADALAALSPSPVAGPAAVRSPLNRAVRTGAIALLVADLIGGLATGAVILDRRDSAPAAPVRERVVESRCIDGHIDQSIDDGAPGGLLAHDTGVSC